MKSIPLADAELCGFSKYSCAVFLSCVPQGICPVYLLIFLHKISGQFIILKKKTNESELNSFFIPYICQLKKYAQPNS